jgi:DNA-binding transcriptional LysR family regulator
MAMADLQWDSRIGRRLKLRDLHVLFAVVQWGSMAKAAAHLGMSQPAVSAAIASLEDALRVRLLDRGPRGVEPTIYAEALLKRGLVVFDELRQGIRDIEFLADPATGEVRVGCPESLVAGFLPAVIDRFSRRYPQVVVHVIHAQTALQEFRELRERSVDLMLGRIFKPVVDDELGVEILGDDEELAVAGARSPWARRRKIALAELRDEPWIAYPPNNILGAFMREAFRANGLEPPRESVTSFSMHVRMHLLATGRFLTILHGSVLRRHAKRWSLKALPVDLGIPRVPIAIFTLKNRTLSPVVRLFIEHARAVAKSMTPGG